MPVEVDMIDRTTKVLLLAIAVGLWMNVASTWLQPVPVQAEAAQGMSEYYLQSIEGDLSNIAIGNASGSDHQFTATEGEAKTEPIAQESKNPFPIYPVNTGR